MSGMDFSQEETITASSFSAAVAFSGGSMLQSSVNKAFLRLATFEKNMPVTLQHIFKQIRLRGQVAPLCGFKDMRQLANAQPRDGCIGHWRLSCATRDVCDSFKTSCLSGRPYPGLKFAPYYQPPPEPNRPPRSLSRLRDTGVGQSDPHRK